MAYDNALEIKAGDILILDTANHGRALVQEARLDGNQIHLKLRPEVKGDCPQEITLDDTDYVDIDEKMAAAAEHVRVGNGSPDRPRPEWVRGKCPVCNDDLVSNCYCIGGRGHLLVWECWSSLSSKPTCSYRHVL